MRVANALLSAPLLIACLPSQSVQASIAALTPLTVQLADGAQTASNTYPSGPLANFGGIAAALPGTGQPVGNAGAQWFVSAGETFALVQLTHGLSNPTQSPSFVGSLGSHEFLLEFQTPNPRAAVLEAIRIVNLTGGAPAASVQLDIGNDGTIDDPNLSTSNVASFAVQVGPQPLAVRVIVHATLGAALAASDLISFVLLPENHLQITTVATGCSQPMPPPPPFVQPTFQHQGVALNVPIYPGVAVLGFNPQPFVLPGGLNVPCLLYPSPDAVLVPTVNGLDLPIPAAVRPITIYAQSVGLTAAGLVTSDAFSILAF